MRKKLILFPFNGNAIEALDCIDENFEIVGFVDDAPNKIGLKYHHLEVFNREILSKKELFVLAVPGSPNTYKNRKIHIDSLNLPDYRFVNIVHPKAVISNYIKIGINNLIMGGAVLTSNAQIGSHNCILPNSVIHHDAKIGDYNLIGSSVVIAGNVNIGNNNYIGSATSFRNNLEIGNGNLFGIASNVVSNFGDNQLVYGNPAKIR